MLTFFLFFFYDSTKTALWSLQSLDILMSHDTNISNKHRQSFCIDFIPYQFDYATFLNM